MKTHDYGDAPISQEYRAQMEAVMKTLDVFFNGEQALAGDRKTAIVVMTFPFGNNDDARCNFMSNGVHRDDLVALFKEMIARFNGQPQMKGNA